MHGHTKVRINPQKAKDVRQAVSRVIEQPVAAVDIQLFPVKDLPVALQLFEIEAAALVAEPDQFAVVTAVTLQGALPGIGRAFFLGIQCIHDGQSLLAGAQGVEVMRDGAFYRVAQQGNQPHVRIERVDALGNGRTQQVERRGLAADGALRDIPGVGELGPVPALSCLVVAVEEMHFLAVAGDDLRVLPEALEQRRGAALHGTDDHEVGAYAQGSGGTVIDTA